MIYAQAGSNTGAQNDKLTTLVRRGEGSAIAMVSRDFIALVDYETG